MTPSSQPGNWLEQNQWFLASAVAEVRHELEDRAESSAAGTQQSADGKQRLASRRTEALRAEALGAELRRGRATAASAKWPDELPPPAIETLCVRFGLSPFERSVLLLCAGMELDSAMAEACGKAHGESGGRLPTFSLALAALPDAHWSAIAPARPLRYWRLVDVGPGQSLTTSALRIDERILHYLCGVPHVDERLSGVIAAVGRPSSSDETLAPSQAAVAEKLALLWESAQGRSDDLPLPVVHVVGRDALDRRAVAASACHRLGLPLFLASAAALPTAPSELETLVRLWEREAILGAGALLLECDDVDANDALRNAAVNHVLERLRTPLVLSSSERRPARVRQVVYLDVERPDPSEQLALWRAVLGPAAAALNGNLDKVVAQFSFSPAAIETIGSEVLADHAAAAGGEPARVERALWDLCRRQARPKLDDLAQHIVPAATWDDIVLPDAQVALLRAITAQVRQRMKVYDTWGFADKGDRGLGISVLFAGSSGTGKTMAAEVLANDLRLDLYRIDLSAVVSKYIGETEKNLRRVFDAAEEGGAILLFDEADALFGKRSEVKDSHDRYANVEVSYLLQRMEAYRGLAILTTNMKQALDTAFLRRLRFVVEFPFPDAAQRAEIWRRVFPKKTPTDALDPARLARLNVSGGNIRNIALCAAFLAAEAGERVRMSHVLQAAKVEYAKIERPLTEAEAVGWK
jgi:hypothetical protein